MKHYECAQLSVCGSQGSAQVVTRFPSPSSGYSAKEKKTELFCVVWRGVVCKPSLVMAEPTVLMSPLVRGTLLVTLQFSLLICPLAKLLSIYNIIVTGISLPKGRQ